MTSSLEEQLNGVVGRLVVRLPNWIGDAMLAVPAVRAVRAVAPQASLELHARPAVADVFASFHGVADRIVAAGETSVTGVLRDAQRLRGAAACVLLPNSFASALPPFLARVPLRAGAATDGRGALLSCRTHPDAHHMAAYYREVVGAGPAFEASDAGVEVDAALREVCESLTGPKPYVIIVPGAAFGTAKRWLPERFGAVGRRLRASGRRVLVLGTAGERSLAERVAAEAGGTSLAGATSGTLFAGVVARAQLAIVNDSGAMHVAAGLGTPLVAIFGATDPAATGPITGPHRILHRPPRCSPCGARTCPLPVHECMEAIGVDEVESAANELLAGRRADLESHP